TGVNLLGRSVLTQAGGLTQIADNQIVSRSDTECAGFAALISSADDLSFTDNQVRVNTAVEMRTSVQASAFTLRVLGNRFSEPLPKTIVSCRGSGGMVTATSNQATHCLVFSGTSPTAVSLNLVNPHFSEHCKALTEAVLDPQISSGDLAVQMKALADVQKQVDAFQSSLLDQAHTALASRADKITTMAKVLPLLKDRAQLYGSIAASLKDTQEAVTGMPKPLKSSFVLHGRVLSTQGQPRAGVNVTLSDSKGVVNNRLAPVKTDNNGYFTVTLRAAEFPDLAEGSQLFVSVADAKQHEIAKPEQPAIFQPGSVAIMPIAG
ncbi:MAG: carboxypeptidase regulatory-like domain-containing protein, partial [Acidobacteriota bacterium]|nr:carboxypeptidase regulatory-like domain-containing protein [Acidobacteriota bacterium]